MDCGSGDVDRFVGLSGSVCVTFFLRSGVGKGAMDAFVTGKKRSRGEEKGGFVPLAERLRPTSLSEIIGQEHLVGDGVLLRRLVEADHLCSIILWGPPGCGKTTLAKVLAKETSATFVSLSAVTAGVGEVRSVISAAMERKRGYGAKTILFLDEVHRFNKAQQDALLPSVESGVLILIGATTENPSFEVNAALLSRCRVFTMKRLGEDHIVGVLQRALSEKRVRHYISSRLRSLSPFMSVCFSACMFLIPFYDHCLQPPTTLRGRCYFTFLLTI